jgi:hypothetical protein
MYLRAFEATPDAGTLSSRFYSLFSGLGKDFERNSQRGKQ